MDPQTKEVTDILGDGGYFFVIFAHKSTNVARLIIRPEKLIRVSKVTTAVLLSKEGPQRSISSPSFL